MKKVIFKGNWTKILDRMFWNAHITGDLIIPDGVTIIEYGAFMSSTLLNIVIPNSVITIGDYAFINNNLSSIIIPNSVTLIENSAFQNNNLQYVLINEGSNLTTVYIAAFSTYNYDHTLTIYNNSGKSFNWGNITQNRSDTTYTFVTGSIPSYIYYTSYIDDTYGPVEVVTGYPE